MECKTPLGLKNYQKSINYIISITIKTTKKRIFFFTIVILLKKV